MLRNPKRGCISFKILTCGQFSIIRVLHLSEDCLLMSQAHWVIAMQLFSMNNFSNITNNYTTNELMMSPRPGEQVLFTSGEQNRGIIEKLSNKAKASM